MELPYNDTVCYSCCEVLPDGMDNNVGAGIWTYQGFCSLYCVYANAARELVEPLFEWTGKSASVRVRQPGPRGPGYEVYGIDDRRLLANPSLVLTKTDTAVFQSISKVPNAAPPGSWEWRLWLHGKCMWQRCTSKTEP